MECLKLKERENFWGLLTKLSQQEGVSQQRILSCMGSQACQTTVQALICHQNDEEEVCKHGEGTHIAVVVTKHVVVSRHIFALMEREEGKACEWCRLLYLCLVCLPYTFYRRMP